MTVYVDDMGLPATVQNGDRLVSGKWCHLYADTHEELMEVARRAGLNPKWIQYPGTAGEHFDVAGQKLEAVVRAGAQPVPWTFTGQFFAERNGRALGPDKTMERCEDIGCTDHPEDDPDTDREPRVLLVTGPREVTDEAAVARRLRPEFSPDVVLLTGGARGVDTIAARLWRQWGGRVEEDRVTPEEWARSKGAGFARNDRMVARVKASGGTVLALEAPCTREDCARAEPHNTHGTSHCADAAERAGLTVSRQPITTGPAARQAPRPAEPRRPAEARKRHRWPPRQRGECRAHDQCLDCGTWANDAKQGKPCQPPQKAPEAAMAAAEPAGNPRPADGPARHSWGEVRDGVRTCQRESCGMSAEQRWNPATEHPLVIYSRGGQRLVSERVPACGSALPGGDLSDQERRHLTQAADRQAGQAYHAGDLDRAFRLLTDARCLDPALPGLDRHERQMAASATQRQPQPAPGPASEEEADPAVIRAEAQFIHDWNAGLPRGICGPEWHQCPEHGAHANTEREGAA